jgi:hypothetical protein
MKLYFDDRLVKYKTTKINPLSTKAEIDGLLASYGIKKTMWEWDIANNKVILSFQISELIGDKAVEPVIRVEPPRIWNKGNRKRKEEINWAVSMRYLHWFLKSHLEMAYSFQSDKTTEFLPFIQVTEDGKTLKDIVVPRLDEIKTLRALPSAYGLKGDDKMTSPKPDTTVRCSRCGKSEKVNFQESLTRGWKECCGQQMAVIVTHADVEKAVQGALAAKVCFLCSQDADWRIVYKVPDGEDTTIAAFCCDVHRWNLRDALKWKLVSDGLWYPHCITMENILLPHIIEE